MKNDRQILITKSAIMEYIGINNTDLFQQFIRNGLPARIINNRWYAHKENIDAYFKRLTDQRIKTKSGKIEDAE